MKSKQCKYRAPFGCNSQRFSINGIHPQYFVRNPALLLLPKVRPIKNEDELEDLTKNTKFKDILNHIKDLRPTKQKKNGGKSAFTKQDKVSKKKQQILRKRGIKGLNWKLAVNTEISSKIPPVLYLDTWEKHKLQEELLSPTKYNIKTTFKPYRTSGVMESKGLRFYYSCQEPNKNPGPGSYGGNITTDKQPKCSTKRGFLTTARKISPKSGDYLAPNVYFTDGISDIDKYIEKRISIRGPYDLFSGSRSTPIRTGWLPEPLVHCDRQFVPSPEKIVGGQFSTSSRQIRPSGRLVCQTCTHFWRNDLNPGPAHYSPISVKSKSYNAKEIPFSKGSRRFEPIDARRFYGDYGVCGPGRYEIKSEFCPGKNVSQANQTQTRHKRRRQLEIPLKK